MTAYRTLVFAEIVQESALSIGGNQPHKMVDIPLARDGRNRPVLRGSSLAGAFIATARGIFGSLPRAITSESDERELTPSCYRFAHAHLLPGQHSATGFFQHVSIDPRTQSAKDDHLFNVEALPKGMRWYFEMEIVPPQEGNMCELEAIAAATLREWENGGIRLGRGSRHGYGWCSLQNVFVACLDKRHAQLWPDAFASERTAKEWLDRFRIEQVKVLDIDTFMQANKAPIAVRQVHPIRHLTEINGRICVGERQDNFGKGYGIDTLSIGGHARIQLQASAFFDRVIKPSNISFKIDAFDPDFAITAMPELNGDLKPYIPGASIRGILRAALQRHAKHEAIDSAIIDRLFGSTSQAGSLSVSDATLSNDDWKLLWQQHVAIDEFSGGVYGSSKFDRLALAHAEFRWQARIEADSVDAINDAELICALIRRLGEGHLPLGGGIWRGHGHVHWQVDTTTIRRLGNSAKENIA